MLYRVTTALLPLLALVVTFGRCDTVCTQSAYYAAQPQESFQVVYRGNTAWAVVIAYGATSLTFPANPLGNDGCNYLAGKPNGWNVECLSTDCCLQNLTKQSDSATFTSDCGVVTQGAVSSVLATTMVQQTTVLGEPIGDLHPVNVFNEPPKVDNCRVPSSVSVAVRANVYGDPQYGAGINGYTGYDPATGLITSEMTESVNNPYYVVNQCISVTCAPGQQSCTVIPKGTVINENSYAYANFDIITWPADGHCGCTGVFSIQQQMGCRPGAVGCNMTLLSVSPYVTATVDIELPDCATVSHSEDVTASMSLENADGQQTLAVKSGEPFTADVQLTGNVFPVVDIDCDLTVVKFDWQGNELDTWTSVQDDPAFSPSTEATVSREAITFTIPPSYVDLQGNSLQLTAVCPLQWTAEQRRTSRDALPSSVTQTLYFSVDVTTHTNAAGGASTGGGGASGDEDGDHISGLAIGVFAGVVGVVGLLALAAIAAGVVAFHRYRSDYTRIRE